MSDQKSVIWVFVGAIVAGAFSIAVWPTAYRYENISGNTLVRINRFTGQAQSLSADGWKPMKPSTSAPGVSGPELLPESELSKLHGTAGWCFPSLESAHDFCVELYNGSDFVLSDVTVTVVLKNQDGSTKWKRRFLSEHNYIGPLSTGMLSIDLPERSRSYSWGIASAKGTRP